MRHFLSLLIVASLASLTEARALNGPPEQVEFEASVWFESKVEKDACTTGNLNDVSIVMEPQLNLAYEDMGLVVRGPWIENSSLDNRRTLRGPSEVDREACGCVCWCPGSPWLCQAYCPGWRRRLTLKEEGKEDRELRVTPQALEQRLVKACSETLKSLTGLPETCLAGLKKAKCYSEAN